MNNKKHTFASSLSFPDIPKFAARAHPLMMPPKSKLSLLDEMNMFFRVLRIARKEKVLLLNSAWGRFHPDLLAAVVIGFWPRRYRPVVVMAGDMFEPNRGLRRLIENLVVKLADRAIHRYAVQSSGELTVFPATWGVSSAKTRFSPYYFSITREQGGLGSIVPSTGTHVFSGGNSHRDYESLLEAAKLMPETKFVFATRRLEGREDIPPNVTAGPVSHQEFISLMASAAAVVIAMRKGLHRAVGHQTYLNAMWLGKPTIVNDGLGVGDYIKDGETAFVVDGSPEGYVQAINWVIDPVNKERVSQVCDFAQKEVREKFNAGQHAEQLLAIIDEAVEREQLNRT